MVKGVFLTGEPGVGKSTLVRTVWRRLGLSAPAVGFTTAEQLNEKGDRCGFRSMDVASPSRSVQLASMRDPNQQRKIALSKKGVWRRCQFGNLGRRPYFRKGRDLEL